MDVEQKEWAYIGPHPPHNAISSFHLIKRPDGICPNIFLAARCIVSNEPE